jgi:hypothetical protein
MDEVTPLGGRIITTRDPLPATCVNLGEVAGKGGGGPGGMYISNASLVEYAQNDLRNQAAARGATHVRLDPPVLGGSNGPTTSAMITGIAYKCPPGMQGSGTAVVGEAAAAESDALVVEVQRHPKWPELGATMLEAKALCEHQRGQWDNQREKVSCLVRREKLFVCDVAGGSMIQGCTHWKLGADTADERDSIIGKKGQPTSTSTAGGFRAYTWQLPDETITLTGTSAGVVVTDAKTLASAPPTVH